MTGDPLDTEELVATLHRRLLDADPAVVDETTIADTVRRHAPLLTTAERAEVARRLDARIGGLGPLDRFLDRDDVNEIMVNGPGRVWIERCGVLETTSVEITEAELDLLVERIVAPTGRLLDPRRPWVDGRLADGSRIHVIAPPVAVDGPVVTIRRFVLGHQTIEAFAAAPAAGILRAAVAAGRSILVSGGTGTGKTTLLNALAATLAAGLRIVTVEDAAELQLDHPHVVRLEARPPGGEGVGEVTLRDLVRNALRMRPDRLVVGEVRGAEAFDLVQALNTGHRGCLATLHANSPTDALDRLATLVLSAGSGLPLAAIERQIAAALDVVVQVARTGGAAREVVDIAEVAGPGRVGSVLSTPEDAESVASHGDEW